MELRIPDDASGSRTGGDPDTADLVRRAQQGDLAAFDRLYAAHVDRVYALCLRMSGQREQAEQLTQDAFVRAWEKLRLFRGESAFGSWLYRLAVNVILEDRRADRRRTAPLHAGGDRLLADTPARTGAPDLRLDLERAIAALPPRARAVLVLYDVEGYPQEEVARMLGVAIGTVKAQLHRARSLLREMLG